MIDIHAYDIFNDSKDTIKKTSKDTTNNEYMTNCTKEVVNFDKVSKKYCHDAKISSIDSNDALVLSSDGKNLTFIEFKNGRIDNKTIYSVTKKLYNSVLILSDIIGSNITSTRQWLDYILVYNSNKNPEDENPSTVYRESKSRDMIDKTLLGFGNKTHIKFGLEYLKGFCFNDVNTYTQDEFEQYFTSKL